MSGSSYELAQPHFPYPGTQVFFKIYFSSLFFSNIILPQTVRVPAQARGELLAYGLGVRFTCEASGWQV